MTKLTNQSNSTQDTEGLLRVLTFNFGLALSSLGRWIAWPGNELSNFGIWVTNINCPCEMCRDARLKAKAQQ